MEDERTTIPASMRKLALWSSRNFQPLFTHKQLEPIMSTLGFTALLPASPSFDGGIAWKEYVFAAGGADGRPRPRLPHPKIDGLHNHTYQAFLEAVNFHLRMYDISTVFHVRSMPMKPMNRVDLYRKWRLLEEDGLVYVYREGTLDQATHKLYTDSEGKSSKDGLYDFAALAIRNKGGESEVGQVVALEDIIVSPDESDPF